MKTLGEGCVRDGKQREARKEATGVSVLSLS